MKRIIDFQRAARNLKQCLGKVRDYLDKNPGTPGYVCRV